MSTTTRLPKYRLHKPSGLAVVRLSGRDLYLGKHGTSESRNEYQRLISEWLSASGRDLLPIVVLLKQQRAYLESPRTPK